MSNYEFIPYSAGSGGGGGSSSPAIIEVAELPTENIDTSAFYKLITGTIYMMGIPYPIMPVVVVSEFPDTGSEANIYFNIQDGKAYQYDGASSSYTDASQTFPAVCSESEITQGGICVFIQSEIWYYYGEWKKVQPPRILKSFTSTQAEIFAQGMLGVIQRGGEVYHVRFDNLTIGGIDFSAVDFEIKHGVKKPKADGTVVETIVFTYYDLNFGVSLYFTASGLGWLGGFMVKDGGSVAELTDNPFGAERGGTFTYFE